MVGIRTVAALVSVANGIWGIIAGTYWSKVLGVGASSGGGNVIILALGFILVLDSLVCLLGSSRAFYVSAIISVAIVLVNLSLPVQIGGLAFIGSCALAAVTIILDALAATHKKYVSEENHPMNLPVFG